MSEPAPLGISFPNILFQLFNFVLFLWVLHRMLYRPIMNTLQRRRERIAESLQAAESLRTQVEQERAEFQAELAAARADAHRIRDEAARTAETIRTREMEQARLDADRMRAEAQADIERTRATVAQALRHQAAALVLSATSKVLNRSIDDPEHRRLVQEALSELDEKVA